MSKRTAKLALMMIALGCVLMFAGVAPVQAGERRRNGGGGRHRRRAADHERRCSWGARWRGLAILGGGLGIGRIGGSAVESIARQPEAAGQISTAMIITAALIEGAMLFAVVVGLLASIG